MLSSRNVTVIFMTIMLHKHFVRFYFILIYGLSLVQEKNLYKMCMQINHCKNKFFISQPTQNTDLYFNFHVAPFPITQQIRKFENNSSLFLSCSTFWTSNCKRRFPEEEWIVLYRLLHVCTIFFLIHMPLISVYKNIRLLQFQVWVLVVVISCPERKIIIMSEDMNNSNFSQHAFCNILLIWCTYLICFIKN